MKAIFLAAGTSSRMDPLSDKNFLNFQGKPLILKLLENAHKAGVGDFIIVGNKGNFEKIQKLCQEHLFLETSIITTQPKLEEGMAGGILEGLSFVEDEEDVLIHNGNDLVDFSVIKKVITTGKNKDGAILGQKVETYFPGGYLEINSDKQINSIIEKPGEGNEPSNLVNIVVHYFSKSSDLKSALENSKSDSDDVYEVALDSLFKSKNFKAVEYSGVWQAIKYPWHVLEMMDIFLKSQIKTFIHPSAEIAESAIIKEGVYIDEGVKVFENAVISESYIGKNSIIGNNVLIRNSNIGNNCIIGYNTEIARSFLSDNITTHIAYIGDSIIDEGVNFGAFSCTANLRLDKETIKVVIKEEKINSKHNKLGAIVGKKVQIGIGAKLMPGCKIPVETLVRPGEIWY